jgi:NAD(P)-dependent dehydrogenase (short-subunit alcohol dehydrogenase family)
MSKPLVNRIALVTGAARGIGAATAAALADAGAHVIVVGRSLDSLKATEQKVRNAGGAISCEALDLADLKAIPGLAASVDKRFGKLDVLVGNAAKLGSRPTLNQTDIDDWQSVIAVNLTANVQLIRCFDALLQKSDAPRAVFITAGSAQAPMVKGSAYTVAKAGLEALVRIYAVENANAALRANLFNPGPVRTSMRATVAPKEDPMTLDTPEQVAEKIVSVCLPSVTVTGKLYSYPNKKFMNFSAPVPI